MDHVRLIKLSKRMSKALRHDPGRAGLVLDEAGWVAVEEFLLALRIGRAEFDTVVAGNDKQRFAVRVGLDGVERVRASQGHSIPVDLQLTPPVATRSALPRHERACGGLDHGDRARPRPSPPRTPVGRWEQGRAG